MPGGDRTGPWGAGPMTGRGAGICSGNDMPGYMNPAFRHRFGGGPAWRYVRGLGGGFRRGFGRGFGAGFGRGRGYIHGGAVAPWWSSVYPNYSDPGATALARYDERGELATLKDQARHFSRLLDDINKRVEELQKATERDTEK